MRQPRAFTLAELVMALSITALIGLSVAGATMVLSSSYAASQTRGRNIQTARSLLRRLEAQVRPAKLVTACDATGLVLWETDENGDGQINVTELRVLLFSAGVAEVQEHRIVFPSWWPAVLKTAMDATVPLAAVDTVGESWGYMLAYNAYRQGLTTATDVSALSFNAAADVPLTELLGIQVSVGQGRDAVTLRTAARLRASETGRVGQAGGQWVLQ